eukprot:g1857.t1
MTCKVGNKHVRDGWSGKGAGMDFCNDCKCASGNLFCSKDQCRPECRKVDCPNADAKRVCKHPMQLPRPQSAWRGCCFDQEVDCGFVNVVDTASGRYWGSAPYLKGGGKANKKGSEKECRDECMATPECLVGTFVPTRLGQRDQKGECWLSKHISEQQKDCGKPCGSFKKIPLLTDPTSSPTTAPTPVPLPTCTCDPARSSPSSFTFCTFDLLAAKVMVHHLPIHSHGSIVDPTTAKIRHAGEHHVCRLVGKRCRCCDCMPNYPRFYHGPGTPSNIRPTTIGQYVATEPYLLGGGAKNKQPSEHACQSQCAGMPKCRVGTYIVAGKGDGECWLSTKALPAPSACTMECSSFEKIGAKAMLQESLKNAM